MVKVEVSNNKVRNESDYIHRLQQRWLLRCTEESNEMKPSLGQWEQYAGKWSFAGYQYVFTTANKQICSATNSIGLD
jgi:hypothetical protein